VKKSFLEKDIETFEEGLLKNCGERGSKLSQG